LTGTVLPPNATNQAIVWSVKAQGTTGAVIAGTQLTASAAGQATVTAAIANGAGSGAVFTTDFNFTVNSAGHFVAVTDIAGVSSGATAGTPHALTGTVLPPNATNQAIVWSVKDSGTTGAVIAGTQLVAAAGQVTVTAAIANGVGQGAAFTKDFAITVNSADTFVAVTDISGVSGGATAGTPLALTGTVSPANATNQAIVWSVKTPGTTGAVIAGTQLIATAAGQATVTATIANGAGPGAAFIKDFTITVNSAGNFVAVTDISGVPAATTAGTSLALTGTVSPANATNQAIVWSIKNSGTTGAVIAGKQLTATAAGQVTVTATIANGAGQGL
jgi:endo-1,4-beta-xylanase